MAKHTAEKAQGNGHDAAGGKKPGFSISESSRNALFALLAVLAIGAAAYVFFFSGPSDSPSDGSEFYASLVQSKSVAILYDVRDASQEQATAIFQCGVDIISKGRFAGKGLRNIACDSQGCLEMVTGSNGSNKMSFDTAKKEVSGAPYVLIKPGTAGYALYQRHMEIYISGNATDAKCDISATES